jgi:hypothetical protein
MRWLAAGVLSLAALCAPGGAGAAHCGGYGYGASYSYYSYPTYSYPSYSYYPTYSYAPAKVVVPYVQTVTEYVPVVVPSYAATYAPAAPAAAPAAAAPAAAPAKAAEHCKLNEEILQTLKLMNESLKNTNDRLYRIEGSAPPQQAPQYAPQQPQHQPRQQYPPASGYPAAPDYAPREQAPPRQAPPEYVPRPPGREPPPDRDPRPDPRPEPPPKQDPPPRQEPPKGDKTSLAPAGANNVWEARCLKCHAPQRSSLHGGGMALHNLTPALRAKARAAVTKGTMPPAEEPRLTRQEFAELLARLD